MIQKFYTLNIRKQKYTLTKIRFLYVYKFYFDTEELFSR